MEAIVNDVGCAEGFSEAPAMPGADNSFGVVGHTNYSGLEIVAGHTPKADEDTGRIEVRLRESIAARGITLAELAQLTGVSVVNLSVLKNGRARAIRFSTLAKLCAALDCQPGDLLSCRGKAGGQQAAATATSAAQPEAARSRAEAS